MEYVKLLNFMYGAITVSSLGVGLFFLKFWRKTGDRFFAYFAAAFALIALERVCFILMDAQNDIYNEVYSRVSTFRLLAFILIIVAIRLKNRKPS